MSLPILQSMVEKFQCPGCLRGSDTSCGKYSLDPDGFSCENHAIGTSMLSLNGLIKFALGLPKGFNRPGLEKNSDNVRHYKNQMEIRFHDATTDEGKMKLRRWWNHLNVAVWAMEQDGYLFVRTFSPRINTTYVDVVKGGSRTDLVPDAINVADFIDDID